MLLFSAGGCTSKADLDKVEKELLQMRLRSRRRSCRSDQQDTSEHVHAEQLCRPGERSLVQPAEADKGAACETADNGRPSVARRRRSSTQSSKGPHVHDGVLLMAGFESFRETL